MRVKGKMKSFYQDNKGPFYLSAIIFLASFFGSILYMDLVYTDDIELGSKLNTSNYIPAEGIVWYDIFFHNFFILIPIFIGVFTLGFVSFWYIFLQGNLLGSSIYFASQELHLTQILKFTLFHGVFEFLAVIIAGTIAFKPIYIIFKHLFLKKGFFKKSDFRDAIILFFLFIIFLVVAALIEGFITVNL